MKTRKIGLLACAAFALVSTASVQGQPLSTIQFTSARYSVNENGGTVTLTVERIGEPGGTAFVEYATSSGTATNGEDYVEQRSYLQFIGETNLTIVIPILNDAVVEQDETFSVTLFNPDPFDTQLGLLTTAVVTILDNDRARFSASSYTVVEGAGEAVIMVRVSGESTDGVILYYFTFDNGDAKADEDYVPQNGWLTFAAGETEKAILVPILDDTVPEGDETLGLGLAVTGLLPVVLRIRDNDGIVEFGKSSYSAEEDGGMAVITVSRTDASTNAFSVDYSTGDGCSAAGGIDYLPQNGRLTFAAGETEGTFAVPILDNALPEGDKTVKLILSNPFGIALGSGSNAVLWIRDNDSPMDRGAELTPQRLGRWSASTELNDYIPTDVAVAGDSVYLTGGVPIDAEGNFFSSTSMVLLDVTDEGRPRLVGSSFIEFSGSPIPQAAVGVKIVCDHAFFYGHRLCPANISQPTMPPTFGECAFVSSPYHAAGAVEGNRAYLSYQPGFDWFFSIPGGVAIFDLSNPDEPRALGRFEPSDFDYTEGSMAVVGEYVYLPILTWEPWLGRYRFSFRVIDFREPWNPQPVAEIDWIPKNARFTVVGNFAYVTAGNTMSVLEVRDPLNPRQIASLDLAFPVRKSTVAGGYAYVGTDAGLALIDIRDPLHPRQASFYPTERPVLAVAVSGDRAYLAESDGLEILDLTPLAFLPGSLTRKTDGRVQFTLNTRPLRSYTVQASTNLVDWESLGTLTAPGTRLIFTDTNSPSFGHRFYRAVSP